MAEKQKLSVYSRQEIPRDVSVIEVDGKVVSTRAHVAGVFDHHRTGARVNLDEVPDRVGEEVRSAEEFVTSTFDADYLISAIVLRMGGKENIKPRDLRILYAASEFCDYLESDEKDEEIKKIALGVFLYLKNKGFKLVTQICKEKGLMTPEGRTKPNDAVMSEVANILGDELEESIKNGTLEKIQDYEYLGKKEPMQTRWKEANKGHRNDDVMAVAVFENEGEYIDPLFAYELVKGKLLITVKLVEGGKFSYTIGLKPSSYKELDLTPLIEVMNENDPNVIKQVEEGVSKDKQFRWGGRSAAFGSPFNVYSGLAPDKVEKLVEENLEKCLLVEGLS